MPERRAHWALINPTELPIHSHTVLPFYQPHWALNSHTHTRTQTSCSSSRYWRRSMEEGRVMEPMRSSVCAFPLPGSPPWLPVLLPLSLRASRCQSPARTPLPNQGPMRRTPPFAAQAPSRCPCAPAGASRLRAPFKPERLSLAQQPTQRHRRGGLVARSCSPYGLCKRCCKTTQGVKAAAVTYFDGTRCE